jgi:hypothetical protein
MALKKGKDQITKVQGDKFAKADWTMVKGKNPD